MNERSFINNGELEQESNMSTEPGRRVALVAGLRTPFAKQTTSYRTMSALTSIGECLDHKNLARWPAKRDGVV